MWLTVSTVDQGRVPLEMRVGDGCIAIVKIYTNPGELTNNRSVVY